MSVAEEESQAYAVGSRATVTGLNFFSMFKFSDGQIKFAGYPAEDIAEGDSQSLKEYVKTTSKELRRGALEPAQIQRRMYWFLTKILEYGLFPSGPTFARVMAFYQASVIELDEK